MTTEYICKTINKYITTTQFSIGFNMMRGGKTLDKTEYQNQTVRMEVYYVKDSCRCGSYDCLGDLGHVIIRCPCSYQCKCAIYESGIRGVIKNVTDDTMEEYAKSLTPGGKLAICKCKHENESGRLISYSTIRCLDCNSDDVNARLVHGENIVCVINCEECKEKTEFVVK